MDYSAQIAELDQNVSGGMLFSSLGTFWTQIFNERGTIRGLTLGQAEEAIQQYFQLVEAIAAYSVTDCPVFALEKWLPVIIKKSQYNKIPFLFEPNGAKFGVQPESDNFYAGQVFQFGSPKTPRPNIFAYNPSVKFGNLGVMANRILTPTAVFTSGTEFYYDNGVLYFNFDLFNDPRFPKTASIGDAGVPETYVDSSGATQEDEFTVAWFYCAEIDTNILYDTYGRIFNIEKSSSVDYKALLENLLFMHTDGPTVENITSVVVAFCGEVPVQEQVETVEDFFTDGVHNIVVTDVNVYKVDTSKPFRSDMRIGLRLKSGEAVTNTVVYYDNVQTPAWWKTQIRPNFGVGENVLFGNYQSQVYFANDIKLLTVDWDGNVHFPVTGSTQDVATFNAHLDQDAIKSAFGLSAGQVYALNPLDFLFDNFIKNNTALIRLRVPLGGDGESDVFKLYSFLRPHLPPHVWLLFSFEGVVENEFYNNFQNTFPIEFDSGMQVLNADGSNEDGEIEELAPYGYTDVVNRMFAIGKGGPAGFNSEFVVCNDESLVGAVNDGAQTNTYAAGLSTKEVRTIQLLSFGYDEELGSMELLSGGNLLLMGGGTLLLT